MEAGSRKQRKRAAPRLDAALFRSVDCAPIRLPCSYEPDGDQVAEDGAAVIAVFAPVAAVLVPSLIVL